MKPFMQRCDKCHAPVIDEVTKIDDYTVTTTYLNKLHIAFYCPICIEKFNIVTDSKRDILSLGLPDMPDD